MKILPLVIVAVLGLGTGFAQAEILGSVRGPGAVSSYVGQAHMSSPVSSILGSVPQARGYQPAVQYQPATVYQPGAAYNGATTYQPGVAYQPAAHY